MYAVWRPMSRSDAKRNLDDAPEPTRRQRQQHPQTGQNVQRQKIVELHLACPFGSASRDTQLLYTAGYNRMRLSHRVTLSVLGG